MCICIYTILAFSPITVLDVDIFCTHIFQGTGAKFCANCGAPTPAATPQAAPAVQQHQQQLVAASQMWKPQNYADMQMNNYHVEVGYQQVRDHMTLVSHFRCMHSVS